MIELDFEKVVEEDIEPLSTFDRVNYAKNHRDVVPEDITNKTVWIHGCGSLGSNIAVQLTKLGFKRFVLLDFDLWEPHNSASSAYPLGSVLPIYDAVLEKEENPVVLSKVSLLHDIMDKENPDVEIMTLPVDSLLFLQMVISGRDDFTDATKTWVEKVRNMGYRSDIPFISAYSRMFRECIDDIDGDLSGIHVLSLDSLDTRLRIGELLVGRGEVTLVDPRVSSALRGEILYFPHWSHSRMSLLRSYSTSPDGSVLPLGGDACGDKMSVLVSGLLSSSVCSLLVRGGVVGDTGGSLVIVSASPPVLRLTESDIGDVL